jgi:ABC-type dipeptide/oligopeptide/nickel transport system ATPase subunit
LQVPSESARTITHNIGVAEHIADQVAVMHVGQMRERMRRARICSATDNVHQTLLSAVARLKRFPSADQTRTAS